MKKYKEFIKECVYKTLSLSTDNYNGFADNEVISTFEAMYEDRGDLTAIEEMAQYGCAKCGYFFENYECVQIYSQYWCEMDEAVDTIIEGPGDPIQRKPGEVYAQWAMNLIMGVCAQEIVNASKQYEED